MDVIDPSGNPLNERIRNEAIFADKNGLYAFAHDLLNDYLANEPEAVFYRFLLGKQLRELGRKTEAMQHFLAVEKQIDMVPPGKRDLVYLYIALIHESNGEFEDAEQWFRRSCQAGPSSTVSWSFFGTFLLSRERFGEAIQVLERGLQAEGDRDEIHLKLGYCRRALGNYRRALHHFEQAIAIDAAYKEASVALVDMERAIQFRAQRSQI
jgi:tetratricopeptide (TPR) repeat protein